MADTSAVFDRASALIGMGRAPEAAIALGGLAPGGFDERRWPAALDALGAVEPEAASALVDSLVRRGNISPGQRARLLLADAIRWERAADAVRYTARLAQAQQAAADSAEGRIARVRLLLAEIRGLRDPDRLPALTAELEGLAQRDPGAAHLAATATAVLKRITGDPAAPPHPDLQRFLDAEAVRDSLGAPLLAAALFRGVQRTFPSSALAPKALFAAAQLEPDSASSLSALVDSLYPESPYRLAFLTGDAAAFTAIEDSLRTLLHAGQEVPPPDVNGVRPSGRRPPRPATGSRAPEP